MIESIVKDAQTLAYRVGIPMPELREQGCSMELESEVRDWFGTYGYDEEGEELCRQLVIASLGEGE